MWILFIVILLAFLLSYILTRKVRFQTIYFETSAINYLANKSSILDAIATKKLHKKRKNRLRISIVCIWEILMTSNEKQKEDIIFYIQNVFDENLLESPAEIAVKYIEAGCPLKEKYRSMNSTAQINKVWKDLCLDTSKTFNYNHEELKSKTQTIRNYFKRIDRIIADIIDENASNKYLKETIDSIFKYLEVDKEIGLDIHNKKICKLSILFIISIMCAEIEFDNLPIKKFWNKRGINDNDERIKYMFDNYRDLVFRGPFSGMAHMAYNQIIDEGRKVNRGLFWDALHSLYLPYVDIMLTNDKHFQKLRGRVDHFNYKKIIKISPKTIKWIPKK